MNHEALYKGGGLFGRSIVLSIKDKSGLMIPILSLIVTGEAFLLFITPFKGVFQKHKASSQGDDEKNQKPSKILTKMRRNKKPPFIKKVQILPE